MRALGKLKKEPGIWMYDAPMPTLGAHEILIKVKKTAICGTDVHIYKWDEWAQHTIPTPMTVGHEFVGVVEKIGPFVKHLKVGDRIAGEGHLVCGFCRNCREGKRHLCRNTIGVGVNRTGCFAEYIVIPEENGVLLPPQITDEVASFLDPLGNAVHTTLSFNLVGEDVLITGAGPIGIMAAAIAKHVGARHIVITDINPYRLELASKMGATHAVNVSNTPLESAMKELGIREGFGVGLEMSGSISAFEHMIDAMSYGGKMALLGILPKSGSIDWTKVIFKSLFIKGIYGREMYATWHKMIAMLQSGLDITPIITHRFPAHEFQKGFDAMIHGHCGKVILEWD